MSPSGTSPSAVPASIGSIARRTRVPVGDQAVDAQTGKSPREQSDLRAGPAADFEYATASGNSIPG